MSENMTHTPTPWKVGSKYPTDIYSTRAGHAIARTTNPQFDGEDEANAARIVACVNACEGVANEHLQTGSVAKMQAACLAYINAFERGRYTEENFDIFKMMKDAVSNFKDGKNG